MEAESGVRWESVRKAVCEEARSGLAAQRDDEEARPIRLSSSGGAPWRPARWQRAFFELFFLGPGGAAGAAHQDDLLFFVQLSDEVGGSDDAPSLTVRRKGATPPAELQDGTLESSVVDWRASVLLNLVLQTRYLLSVATCGRDALPAVGQSRDAQAGLRQVVTPVYASPMRVAVNLDSSRAAAAAPAPSYPEICFAIDEFDETHHHMVLDDPEQCYAVVLSAVDGPALPPPAPDALPPVSAAAPERTAAAAHDSQKGSGGTPSAGVPRAAGADAQVGPPTHQHSQQQEPRQLEAEYSPAAKGDDARVAAGGTAARGAPSEGVTLWQYVADGGAGTVPIDSRAPPPQPDSPEAAEAALERAFSDPLISPSSRRRLQPGPAAGGVPPAAGPDGGDSGTLNPGLAPAGDLPGVTIFAGFVSCEQLQGVVGSSHARAAAAWAGRSGAAPHRVVMRGPGGLGFADVAVSVVRQQEAADADPDLTHLTLGEGNDSTAAGSTTDGGGRRGRLLARLATGAAGVAAQLAKGVAREVLHGGGTERRPLRCGLMSLSTPIDLLLQEMVAAWPQEQHSRS